MANSIQKAKNPKGEKKTSNQLKVVVLKIPTHTHEQEDNKPPQRIAVEALSAVKDAADGGCTIEGDRTGVCHTNHHET
jgi:hypothetical protein